MNTQINFSRQLFVNIRLALIMLVLCGFLYSPAMTKLGELLFPAQAQGSLIVQNGKVIGSTLIEQPFTADKYFYGRPSAANDDPMAAAGSNLAVSNPALRNRVQADSLRIQKQEGIVAGQIPVDLVAASGSGLDPDISPASAFLQAPRIAKTRGLSEEVVNALIEKNVQGPQWGLLGQPRVNVLQLNLALDQMR